LFLFPNALYYKRIISYRATGFFFVKTIKKSNLHCSFGIKFLCILRVYLFQIHFRRTINIPVNSEICAEIIDKKIQRNHFTETDFTQRFLGLSQVFSYHLMRFFRFSFEKIGRGFIKILETWLSFNIIRHVFFLFWPNKFLSRFYEFLKNFGLAQKKIFVKSRYWL
jgi:hypothetical protein